MLTILRIATIILVSTPALAQQQPSAELRAYGDKLMAEIGAGLTCSTARIELRGQVDALNAEVRRLKDKYEPDNNPAPAAKK